MILQSMPTSSTAPWSSSNTHSPLLVLLVVDRGQHVHLDYDYADKQYYSRHPELCLISTPSLKSPLILCQPPISAVPIIFAKRARALVWLTGMSGWTNAIWPVYCLSFSLPPLFCVSTLSLLKKGTQKARYSVNTPAIYNAPIYFDICLACVYVL